MDESKLQIDDNGNRYWFLNYEWHRIGGAVVECNNGTKGNTRTNWKLTKEFNHERKRNY